MQLISVVIPVYNVEKYLRKCLDSVCGQTYCNLEIIIVEDGSPDNCAAICDDYAKKDNRIRVIHRQNGGLSAARNSGIEAATGDYIVFVDSDDWLESDMIAYLYENTIKYQVKLAICGYYMIRGEHKSKFSVSEDMVLDRDEALYELCKDGKFPNYAWLQLIDRELLSNIRFPEGKKFEDILTTYRIVEKVEKVLLLKEAKYNYYRRNDSITGRKSMNANLERCSSHALRYLDLVKRHPELGDELLRQYFYAYRKMVRDRVAKKQWKGAFEEQKKMFLTVADEFEKRGMLSDVERKENQLLKSYEGGWCIKLVLLEIVRIVSSRIKRRRRKNNG